MKIKIEIQHFHGCPNGPDMIFNVKQAIAGIESEIDYIETLVETNELAERLDFRGSPTLLINGQDFEDMPAPDSPALTCRYYSGATPSAREIRMKIEKIL